jgi:hypothetical protein
MDHSTPTTRSARPSTAPTWAWTLERANQGIGTLLYEARKDLIRERGLKRLLTGGRIAGYAAVADQMTAKEYVAEVVDGKRRDPRSPSSLRTGWWSWMWSPATCTISNRTVSPRCWNG